MKFRCQRTAPEGVLASLPWCLPKELKLKCFSVFSVERSTSHLSAFPSHWWCLFAYLGDSRWFNIFNPYRSSLQCSLKTTILWSLQQAQLHKPRAWVRSMVVLTMFGEVLSYTARWSSEVLEHTLCGVSRGWVYIEMSFCFLATGSTTIQSNWPHHLSNILVRLCYALSFWPDSIVGNSTNARNTCGFLLQSSLEVEPFGIFLKARFPKWLVP